MHHSVLNESSKKPKNRNFKIILSALLKLHAEATPYEEFLHISKEGKGINWLKTWLVCFCRY
jgi:hypothetical protein